MIGAFGNVQLPGLGGFDLCDGIGKGGLVGGRGVGFGKSVVLHIDHYAVVHRLIHGEFRGTCDVLENVVHFALSCVGKGRRPSHDAYRIAPEEQTQKQEKSNHTFHRNASFIDI